MGRLIAGRWTDEDAVIEAGAYVRPPSVFAGAVGAETIAAIAAAPGRFHLIASRSCPWSHRTMLVRTLKDLGRSIPLHIAHGPRRQGYAVDGGAPWTVPGSNRQIVHLHELYTLSDAGYSGRSTVPILWDSREQKILSNESATVMRAFDAVRPAAGRLDFTLRPVQALAEVDALNAEIYEGLSNGVYRAVFATQQSAYDAAIRDVFATFATLEHRLAGRRYLLGSTLTEADLRLFPTLLRFDAVYFLQHRCSYRRLVDYPNVWAYARDLYAWRAVAATLDFDDMLAASYANEPHGIVPAAPDADWHAPHGREALGAAKIALRTGGEREVDARTFPEP